MEGNTREFLAWRDEYDLGVEEIDLQHRYFLSLINRLFQEAQSGDSHQHYAALLKELNAYVRFHFISEENMMRFSNYPALDEHHLHHHNLIDTLNAKESGLSLRYNSDEARSLVDFLVHWFVGHTAAEDKLFAIYLQQWRTRG